MDKEQYIEKILVLAHQENKLPELTEKVCAFFDYMKDKTLSHADMHFLRHISSLVGIPHYYDMLKNFQKDDLESYDLNLSSLSSLIYEKSLCTSHAKLHKHQVEVLKSFKHNRQNHFFLSASTSFGKTFLVYEIIRKMQYSNIALIFPTIALLSENYERIMANKNYSDIREKYQIFTLSECQYNPENSNLFIFTPERFLSFLDKNDLLFDFVFIDEIYKIDNEFIENEESKEHERDTAYRIALYRALNNNDIDMLLAGPFLEFNEKEDEKASFKTFLDTHNFSSFNFNHYQIVNKTLSHDIHKGKKKDHVLHLYIDQIIRKNENAIIYCSGFSTIHTRFKLILKNNILKQKISKRISELIAHIQTRISNDWILTKALEYGVGMHYSAIPKYLQKEIINLFNDGEIDFLFSTTTITEGVNTSAKNLIIYSGKKAKKPLKKFDAKNIEGRAGRFMYHFKGKVINLDADFRKALEGDDDFINHKNYSKDSKKDEIDYFITDDKYLYPQEIHEKDKLLKQANELGIDSKILFSYQSIPLSTKIDLYKKINQFSDFENKRIVSLCFSNDGKLGISKTYFDWLIKLLLPFMSPEDSEAFRHIGENATNLTITIQVDKYLQYGYRAIIDYYAKNKNIEVGFQVIFTKFKYKLVKYLGIFNLIYKALQSQKNNTPIDEVVGIDRLLSKLEYNALTEHGKIISDYGAPNAIIEYYEAYSASPQQAKILEKNFDSYEKDFLEKIRNIIPLQIDINKEK